MLQLLKIQENASIGENTGITTSHQPVIWIQFQEEVVFLKKSVLHSKQKRWHKHQ